ncbi:Syntaxin PEP12 [Nakaseomyces bracarensis]|uniref:Syntaxin PEP12 n=1 Tax=Nakaseomyces bracarensis TaxID=273131 RepID=A0ABR4NPL3_9SACH
MDYTDREEAPGFTDCPEFEPLKDEISQGLFEVNGQVSTLRQFSETLSNFLARGEDIDVNAKVVENINHKAMANITEVNKLLKNINEKVKEIDAIEESSLDRPQVIAREKLLRDANFSLQEFQNVQKRYTGIIKTINDAAKGKLRANQNQAALVQEEEEQQQQQQLLHGDKNNQTRFVIEREPINNEEFAYQQRLIQERDEEITNIERSITELNGIFKDLGAVIQQQGIMVDNIEANIYTAADNTVMASNELERARRYQKKSSKWCLYFLIVLVVMLLFMILVTFI